MRTKPFILVGLYCIALFISCDFKTTIFGDFNSPNDPRTTEYADYRIEVLAGIGSNPSPETTDATTLRLSHVTDLEASGGYLYVADSLHHRVIRIHETSGAASAIAGTGVPGYSGDGGPAASARLFAPTAVLAWDDGSLFILDAMNDAVRRVSADGVISTYADLAALTGEKADLWMQADWNRGCMARLQNDILVYHYHRIYRLSGTIGSVSAVEYPATDFFGTIGGDPNSFGVDDGGALWLSAWLHESQKRVLGRVASGSTEFEVMREFDYGASDSIDFDSSGKVLAYKDQDEIIAYDPSDGSVTNRTDEDGGSVFCINSSGVLYRYNVWCDLGQHVITKMTAPLTAPAVFAGIASLVPTGDPTDRIQPWHLALDEEDGELYYTDTSQTIVRSVNVSTGQGTLVASGLPGSPKGVSIGPGGEIVFSNNGDSNIYRLSGSSYSLIATYDSPLEDVAVAPNGAVFAASFTFSPSGGFTYFTGLVKRVSGEHSILRVGNGTPIAYADPDGSYSTAIPIGAVWAICFGPDGTLYLAEEERRILAVAPTGVVTRISGGIWTETSPDRVWFDSFEIEDEFMKAREASIRGSPRQIAYGADGCLYIAHQYDAVLRVNAESRIEQLRFHLDGRTVDLCARGIAVDSARRLYLATEYQIIRATPRL
ncbi:MAG TPA: hypothetical protein PLW80_01710 [Spirochaetales bacterium]|nr:hypothetical protein [Spirochaetales bacterium]